MIHRAKLGQVVEVFHRSSNFHLPSNSVPVVLVGAGAGVAAVRSLMWERVMLGATETLVFFGCTGKNIDFLYGDEMAELSEQKKIGYFPSFMFGPDGSGNGEFVQHRMVHSHSAHLNALFKRGAHLYVCGNPRTVGSGVADAIAQIMQDEGGAAYVDMLKESGRYHEDLY
jgi:sulfite reductase alpha subunit-like flavoprotein